MGSGLKCIGFPFLSRSSRSWFSCKGEIAKVFNLPNEESFLLGFQGDCSDPLSSIRDVKKIRKAHGTSIPGANSTKHSSTGFLRLGRADGEEIAGAVDQNRHVIGVSEGLDCFLAERSGCHSVHAKIHTSFCGSPAGQLDVKNFPRHRKSLLKKELFRPS
ncbi:MAG: hypothetical protein KM296_00340 [Brockia lithotrophica]|nr:hypothetical protein [Brockia lithotrophica]